MSINKIFLFFSFIAVICWMSCNKDSIYVGDDLSLRFSLDTLRFDTVFTELGSVTRTIKVFNDIDEDIVIDHIRLETGDASFYALNVDGTPTRDINNVRVNANDSIYIFVEVTIDPDQPLSFSPFIIEEWLLFTANGNDQMVLLEAWGQNANYVPNKNGKSTFSYYSCDMNSWIWDDPKPYVIYGGLIIDSCTLILPAGTKVYVHGGVGIQETDEDELLIYSDGFIFFGENGNIVSQGTPDQPVTIFSDRLEEEFQDDEGQWNGIRLSPGSKNNRLDHTIIRHSIVGLRVDSTASATINGCEFSYTSSSGLIGSHGSFKISNSLFYENGAYGILMTYGGDYEVDYCTIANYNNSREAVRIDNFLDVSLFDSIPPAFNPVNAIIRNTILVGNDDDEINLADGLGGDDPEFFNYQFENCLINVNELLQEDQFPNFFNNCLDCYEETNGDTLFINRPELDFHLDTMSIAIDKGQDIIGIEFDKDQNSREFGATDIGCYEFQK